MFIETHKDSDIMLTFIKSANIQVFPCGHRRSEAIDLDGDLVNTPNDIRYIPFDPEARLNTEANHIKHSSLNGFTQTYLKDWDKSNNLLTMALAGYLFNITLVDDYVTEVTEEGTTEYGFMATAFGTAIVDALKAKINELIVSANTPELAAELAAELTALDDAVKIYANILIENVHLYSGHKEYMTGILRNQSKPTEGLDIPETSLDLLNTETQNYSGDDKLAKMENFANYYFSGLSFSTTPLTEILDTRSSKLRSFTRGEGESPTTVNQQLVSLCILEKVKTSADGVIPEEWEWKIHQPAFLPFIEHDVTEDSVVMGETHVRENLTVDESAYVTGNITVGTEENQTSSVAIYGRSSEGVALDVKGNAAITNKIVTKDIEVTGIITATTELEDDTANNLNVRKANIAALTGTTATIGTVNADDIQQKVTGLDGVTEDHYNVPVMFLKQAGEEYQLQITRVNRLN